MRHSAMSNSHIRGQLESAVSNVESALRNLSDRLDDVLPDYGRRRRISRAGRAIRRTAGQVAERVRPNNGASLMDDTRRTVREHPYGSVLMAAFAGWLVWSVLRSGESRHAGHEADEGRSLAGRFRSAMGRQDEESALRH